MDYTSSNSDSNFVITSITTYAPPVTQTLREQMQAIPEFLRVIWTMLRTVFIPGHKITIANPRVVGRIIRGKRIVDRNTVRIGRVTAEEE